MLSLVFAIDVVLALFYWKLAFLQGRRMTIYNRIAKDDERFTKLSDVLPRKVYWSTTKRSALSCKPARPVVLQIY